MQIAIVADDLTGALDACAPLALHGLRCRVATTPEGLDEALDFDSDVVCVNTATREMDAAAAGAIVAGVARKLAAASPAVVVKKIDSRLKGHVAVETAACLTAFGRRRAIIAPAVPSQGRFVLAGEVVGRGVPEPLVIADRIGDAFSYEAPDCPDSFALERIARTDWSDVLLVGASGLTAGLARAVSLRPSPVQARVTAPFLVAIGSHDPITIAQVERATASASVCHVISTDGNIGQWSRIRPTTIVQASIADGGKERGACMANFGASVADLLARGDFRTALLSGGETAQTVLQRMGVATLNVTGEALPGIPLAEVSVGYRTLAILTKSGGFGTSEDILRLADFAERNTFSMSMVSSANTCDGIQDNDEWLR